MTNEDIIYIKKMRDKIVYNCPKCHGTQPFCSCSYDFRLEIRKASANIPIIYRSFRLDDLRHPQLTKQKEAVKRYMDNMCEYKQPDLLISGGRGLGKSSVAACLLDRAMRLSKTVYFFATVKQAVDASFRPNKSDDEELQADNKALRNADVIVIDGFGSGFIREMNSAFESLRSILEMRRLNNKRTIFVSSKSLKELDGAEKDLLNYINPAEIFFEGFDYKKEVLQDYPEKEKQTKKANRARGKK